jgi:DNA topoisomerase-2
MNTPILRATKGREVRVFYNEGEYKKWLLENSTEGSSSSSGGKAVKGWTLKYFKGLGTSTATEFKEYFSNKKIVDFEYSGNTSDDIVDMVFNKKRPEDRKLWLANYDKNAFLNTNSIQVSYDHFFHKEMVHFSVYDNERSIPNLVDGLKTSLRKILYCAFKRRLTHEIKVAQFSGYVSENSAYHHGEASLNGAIVNMAQNFVGSNNLNLLVPSGQFGTRLKGGEDSASERYIFTYLEPITRTLFLEDDDAILNYLNDDGTLVEPEYYVPILPFILMNGSSGIGTGFSSSIPAYHPLDLVKYIRNKLTEKTSITDTIDYFVVDFVPYYEGFLGTVQKIGENKFLIKGKYEIMDENTIRIVELPVGTWTMNYISFLEELVDGGVDKDGKKIAPVLKDITNMSTEVNVNITVVFPKGKLAELLLITGEINGLEKILKLTTTVSTTNMHLFDSQMRLHKYETVQEIIDAFYEVRMNTYKKRKSAIVNEITNKLLELSNRSKYIQGVLDGKIDLRRKTSKEVDDLLSNFKLTMLENSFSYLRKMQMDSVTEENVDKIMRDSRDMQEQLKVLINTSLKQMWLNDLDAFEKKYLVYKTQREKLQKNTMNTTTNSVNKSKKIVIKK